MSFRRRNVGLTGNSRVADNIPPVKEKTHHPGVRPSPIDGRPTTSTGNVTLDGLLAGHAGIALGSSLLIEENGTTDYAGAILRFFAAEGIVQGHHVHVVGMPEQWGRDLPGVVRESEMSKKKDESSEKMKIAWRYERLGQFGTDSVGRERGTQDTFQNADIQDASSSIFCHTFDLTKKLVYPASAQMNFLHIDSHPARSPFESLIGRLTSTISSTPPTVVHRVIIPSLLSPAVYPSHCSLPQNVLKFQHSLRALLSAFSSRLVVIQSMPLSLYSRSSGLTKWLELLNDGVFELDPFPHSAEAEFQNARDPATKEEPPQGLLRIHRFPVFHDRGSGTVVSNNDWTFTLSRRKLNIKPFNLPPIEGDTEAQQAAAGEQKAKKADMEF